MLRAIGAKGGRACAMGAGALLLVAAGCARHSAPAESPAQRLERIGDEAAAEAQTHFDAALTRFERSQGKDASFVVSVRLPAEGDGAFVLGLRDVKRTADGFVGVIERMSPNYPEFGEGSRVTFPRDVIADWELSSGGRTHGQFGMRGVLCEVDGAIERAQRLGALRGGESLVIQALNQAELSPEMFDGACDPFDPEALG